MTEKRATIITEWQFPNGTYIFNSNGIQIDPKSKEGNRIIYLLTRQEMTKLENEEQTEFVNKIKNAKNGEEAIKIIKEHKIILSKKQ